MTAWPSTSLVVLSLLVAWSLGCARNYEANPAPSTAATSEAAVAVDREVPPGSRVRIIAPTLSVEPLEGAVEALWPDTLALLVGSASDERTIVPLSAVERLLVSRDNRAPYGELFGAIGGALAGGLVAYKLAPSGNSTTEQLTRSFAVSVGVAAGVLTGYLLGKQLDRVVFSAKGGRKCPCRAYSGRRA